jgi:hypothetical protein
MIEREVEMRNGMLVVLVLSMTASGCATYDEAVTVTPGEGVERLPAKIAVYPLLTAETVQAAAAPRYFAATTEAADDRLYIVAPAETKLVSTMHSQLMTGLLSAQLSRRGFALKELPVEAPADQSEKKESSFFVSLETLKHLREDFGIEGILVGNVYFVADDRDRTVIRVKAVYLRLVDTGTLDVLCHVWIPDSYAGESMEEAAQKLAFSLAREAKLVSPQ